MNQAFWKISRVGNGKFPYRLVISKGNEILLDLLVQDKWPGTKGNIFCISAKDGESRNFDEELIECVPVSDFRLFGKKIVVILDRPTQKRCSFLFLKRQYKTREGEYEQIFWQTQQGLTQRRIKYKLRYVGSEKIKIFVDSAERYAWNFPLAESIKERLPIGDYAIKNEQGFLAIVERKTFSNIVKELGNLDKFHQHLSELGTLKNSALVIEAAYGDFLDSNKMKPYSGNFGAKAIAEIQSMHPNLPIVFCGSRKAAGVWTYSFFMSIFARLNDETPNKLKQSASKYSSGNKMILIENEVRRAIFSEMPEEFRTSQIFGVIPDIKKEDIRRILKKIESEGILKSGREGRNIVWRKNR